MSELVSSERVNNPPSAGILFGGGGGGISIPSDRPSAGWVKARHGRRPRPEHRERSDRPRSGEGGRERGFRSTRQSAGEVAR